MEKLKNILFFVLIVFPSIFHALDKKTEKKVELDPPEEVTSTEDKKAQQDMQLKICIMPEQADKPAGNTQPYMNPSVPAGPCKPGAPAIPTALPYQPEEFFTTKSHFDSKKMRILFGTDYVSMQGASSTLAGFGLGATALYSLSRKYAVGFSLNQAFISSSFTAFYTQLDFQLKLALTGSLLLRNSSTLLNQSTVIESESMNRGGVRLQLFAHQYFMNTGVASVPFPGVGAGLCYDLASPDLTNYYFGIRIDRASNEKVTLYPIQAFFGVGIWL